jgi:DNA-binding response OmpR family regulator
MSSAATQFTVLVYSDDAAVRERIRFAIGRRPAPDLGQVTYLEATTGEEVVAAADAGAADLLILDAEAWPTGGLGLSRQLKNEILDPPPVLAVLARKVDRWLASWSLAEATLSHPLDPIVAAEAVAGLLRRRASSLPAVR